MNKLKNAFENNIIFDFIEILIMSIFPYQHTDYKDVNKKIRD